MIGAPPGPKAPPFVLPGEHFAAALGFLALAAVGATRIAPELVAGAYPSGRVVALTHLFTLGWITTSIMGALYQFLPVATGEPIRSVRLAHVTFGLFVSGLIPFVVGLAWGNTSATLLGATLFGTAILLFLGNLASTLARTSRRDVTWWSLVGATLFLLITVILGGSLAGNLRWAYLGASRITAIGVHLHIALGGWVLLVIVGVSHKLLPMFLLSHGAGERWSRVSAGLLAAGAGVLSAGHHGPPWVSRWVPAVLLGSGMICFLVQTRRYYRRRHRPVLDPGMRLAAAGLGLMAVGVALGIVVVSGSTGPRVPTAYVATLLLGISLFVAALYYKIVPFLVWFHRFGPVAGRPGLPRVSELYSAPAAHAAMLLLTAGAVGWSMSILLGTVTGGRVAGLVFTTGVGIEIFQMWRLAHVRPALEVVPPSVMEPSAG